MPSTSRAYIKEIFPSPSPHVQERDALPPAMLRVGDLLPNVGPERFTRTTRFPMARKHCAEHEESSDEAEDHGQSDKRPEGAARPRLATHVWPRMIRCAHRLESYGLGQRTETFASLMNVCGHPYNSEIRSYVRGLGMRSPASILSVLPDTDAEQPRCATDP